MLNSLPALLLKNFTEDAFTEIIRIYALVAGINYPCEMLNFPRYEIEGVLKELSDGHSYCEWRLGSSLTRHSKLFIHSRRKIDEIYVVFDFDPNTADDSLPRAMKMREEFHKKVQEYLATIKNT